MKHSQVVWDQQHTYILKMPSKTSSTHELHFWVRPSTPMDNSIHQRPTLFNRLLMQNHQRQKRFLSLWPDSSQAELEIHLKPIP